MTFIAPSLTRRSSCLQCRHLFRSPHTRSMTMATATVRRKKITPVPVRFGEEERGFLRMIEARASAESRSVSGQLKYFARLGMIAKDNPDQIGRASCRER